MWPPQELHIRVSMKIASRQNMLCIYLSGCIPFSYCNSPMHLRIRLHFLYVCLSLSYLSHHRQRTITSKQKTQNKNWQETTSKIQEKQKSKQHTTNKKQQATDINSYSTNLFTLDNNPAKSAAAPSQVLSLCVLLGYVQFLFFTML